LMTPIAFWDTWAPGDSPLAPLGAPLGPLGPPLGPPWRPLGTLGLLWDRVGSPGGFLGYPLDPQVAKHSKMF